ncbi:RNA polymerase sigma-70 factor, ECF subfamily [Filimonas lacunae]|uniref:RNA polymerase sigma-70 factor, ECF subfamily n=1 Tax=Filimonas lacunae TaxID=477680 RepID=A0A173MJQ9_9BACT|nr:RNA polymerase sigma-70 factor [Filimonas lacunae]BAV07872.1 RNA polymerase ECF-type sigma factor [Filimonas lacunae]SIT05859.1 RNA polymerase sigma-70 factor, ECF subfamily [Filimonas lacunae]
MQDPSLYEQKQLFTRLASGDETAFRMLFDSYKSRFYAVALKMTRSEYVAEEIVQEVFVTLWVKRDQLPAIEKPATYLFTIVYNSVYAHFKKLAQEKKIEQALTEQATDLESPLEVLLQNKENEHLLLRAIEQLPPQQKLVYKLIRQEKLSREEVAARLQISPNTVKNHLQEAVKFLRSYLERAMPLLIFLLCRQKS